ncbi:DUF3850 domain-containing protein [Vibrio parahaemolyticus]|uniref:DUF3850 domain-containing protein n=1 Tax=Vibrio parahaemolyticus TaxID=670 RepID=UPI00111F4964|nr:DUF3850 domain-containing protein [Vibrio parahaemolyticus]TNY96431.1 hypothetical protein CGK56_24220 [Vibrio parahaemolyticus]
MARHELKILPQYFDAQLSGAKPFEVRCFDRDYQVGDEILLREIHPPYNVARPGAYTGRTILLIITYLLSGHDFEGIATGYVVLGTKFIAEAVSPNETKN